MTTTKHQFGLDSLHVEYVTDRSQLYAVRHIIETDHYLHRWPDPRSLPMAYMLCDGGMCMYGDKPLGCVLFSKPQHHQQRGLFGYEGLPTAWQVLSLARVYVNPYLQNRTLENGHSLSVFSRMVSLSIRSVQRDWLIHHPPRFPDQPYHIELIISYCDLRHHLGTAYRACSFQSAGLTTDRTKEVYFRKLRPPRKAWTPERPFQPPLIEGMALRHE